MAHPENVEVIVRRSPWDGHLFASAQCPACLAAAATDITDDCTEEQAKREAMRLLSQIGNCAPD